MMAFSLNGQLGLTSAFDMWTGTLMERAPLKRYGHAVFQATTDVGFKIGKKGKVTLSLEGTLMVNGDPNKDGTWNIAEIFEMLAKLSDGGEAVEAALKSFDIGIMATAKVTPVITIGSLVIDLSDAAIATGTFLLWNNKNGVDVRLGLSAQVDPLGILLAVLKEPAAVDFLKFIFKKIGYEKDNSTLAAAVDIIGQTGGKEDRLGIAFSMNFGGLFSLGFSYMNTNENTFCLDLSGTELCGVSNCKISSDCSSVAPFCMDLGAIDVCVGCRRDADCAARSDGKTLCDTVDIFETFAGRLPSYTCIEPREVGEICTYDSSCKSKSCGPDGAFRKYCMECESDKDCETLISTKYNGWGALEKREVRGRLCQTPIINEFWRFTDAGGMKDGYFSCHEPREIGEFCTYDNTCKSGHCKDFLGIGKCVGCTKDTHCGGTTPVCDTRIIGGSFACIPKKDNGESCSYDSTCKSDHCRDFAAIGSCVACEQDSHCSGSTPVCDTRISGGSFACIPKKNNGESCSYDSTCDSNSCYLPPLGTCQCSGDCTTSGCNGCPSGNTCNDVSFTTPNVCISMNDKVGNGRSCTFSHQCGSRCCSYTVGGANTCEDDSIFRKCT